MQGSNRILVLAVLAALALTACSGTATTTTLPPARVAPTTTTTAPPTTTTAAPTTTTTVAPTTTTLPEGTVGDPAALQALAEEVARESLIPIEEFYIPNITQPDPIEALKELVAYSSWVAATFPDKELARIHTIDNSPARTAERNVFDPLESFRRIVKPVTPYLNEGFQIVDIDDLPTTETTRANLPAGAVAIVFVSTSDGYDIVDEETGEVARTVPPWTDLEIYVVVAPTQYGWQEYWYGTA